MLTGPDGTRAVFNDSGDIDFVGYLDPDNCSGLDAPNTRESADVIVEGDGGVHGTFYRDRRFPVLQGIVWPDPDIQTVLIRESKLKRASRALAADSILTWTPTGGTQRRLLLRRASGNSVQITGRRPKHFQLSMVAALSTTQAANENSQVISGTAGTGELGLSFPLTFPLNFAYNLTGASFVLNAGDDITPWRARIDGPITNPVVLNNTTGQSLRLVFTLLAGEFLTIDSQAHTVLFGGTSDRYAAVDFAGSTWWLLQPGNNDIRLLAVSAGTGSQITLFWRNAWE